MGGVTPGTACHVLWEGVEGRTLEATASWAQHTESWTQSWDGDPLSRGSGGQEEWALRHGHWMVFLRGSGGGGGGGRVLRPSP